MAELAPFTGFGEEAAGFLTGLAADNSKAYFDDHRGIYDTQVAAPMKSHVVAVGERLADQVASTLQAEPKIGRSLFRINRDLRFSKDRTPYNPYVDAVFWDGDSPRASPGFILRITGHSVLVGAGVLGLSGERLERFRAAVIDDDRGEELLSIVDAARERIDGLGLSEPTRKRVPKGYSADHPRAEYLRRDGLHLSAEQPLDTSFTTPAFVDVIVERCLPLAPFERWLVANVELAGS